MLRLLKQYYPIRNAFFVLGDFFGIYCSVILASCAILGDNQFLLGNIVHYKAIVIALIFQICLYYNELYDLKEIDTYTELSIRLCQSLGVATIIFGFVYIIFRQLIIGRGVLILSVGFVILFTIAWRFAYNIVLAKGMFNQNIFVLGSGYLAASIFNEIKAKKDCGYTVKNEIPDLQKQTKLVTENSVLTIDGGGYHGLLEIAESLDVSRIVVAIKERRGSFPIDELLNCRTAGIEIIDGNSFYEMLTGKIYVEQTNPGWLIFADGFKKTGFQRFFKRITDIVAAIALLLLVLPIIVITAISIKLESEGPLLFSQERIGKNKKKYMLYKFRSMIPDAESKTGPVWAQQNDDRITRIGKFIRKWRIDEIPQLWNVLKGDMSFVGPRPEREFFINKLETIIPFYKTRFTVKPGLTGWAQVNYGYGADEADAIQKLNYELFYMKNMSFLIDLTVIARTVSTVIFKKGVR